MTRLEFLDFLRTCEVGNLKIQTDLERHGSTAHYGYKTCALHSFPDRQSNADENVNRLESRKLRMTSGCNAGPNVPRRQGVM